MIQPQRLHGKPANIARYYTVGDYYTKGGNEPSEWGGKLAADLGLSGPVDARQFRDLLAGKVGDQQLGRHRTDGQIQHHPGWDFAVNAPKSVSIMALVAGDERVLAAHEHAVTAAITYLEEQAQLRRREEGKIVHETTGRILVTRFTEHGSRELDPHLHTHLVVLNMTNRQDGDPMASLESRVMYGEQRVAGQIYRNALAFSLREAGYEVEFDPRTGLFEIRGVPKELIERFSQRAEAIEEHAREHGLVGQKAQRASFYATRKAKVKIGAQELTVQWHERTGDQLDTLDKIAAVAREREGQHSPLPNARLHALPFSACGNSKPPKPSTISAISCARGSQPMSGKCGWRICVLGSRCMNSCENCCRPTSKRATGYSRMDAPPASHGGWNWRLPNILHLASTTPYRSRRATGSWPCWKRRHSMRSSSGPWSRPLCHGIASPESTALPVRANRHWCGYWAKRRNQERR
ncbi:MobF family relaxase [Sphingobium scionense]